MIRPTGISLFLLFIFLTVPAVALEMNLESVLSRALQSNKDLKLARAEIKLADARVTEAWSSVFPTISTDINYTRNLSQQFIYINGSFGGGSGPSRFSFTFKNELFMTAKLDQTLYSFGKVGTALKIAYNYEDYVKAVFMYQKEKILNSIREGFFRALVLKKILTLAVESESSARENYEQTRVKFESGVSSEYDLLQAEVRWRNAIPATLAARNNFELAINNLKAMIDMPVNEELTLTGSLDTLPPLPPMLPVENALERRADFKALLLEESMRQKNVDLEFANHLPNLSGTFSYSYSGRSDRFKLENDYDNYVVGVQLHIPIFSGGYTQAQVQKARVEVEKTRLQVEQTRQKVAIELSNIHLRLREAFERIQSAQKAVDAARRAFEIAKSRSESGRATQLELKDSRLFLDQARITELNARYDYIVAHLNWQLASGAYSRDSM